MMNNGYKSRTDNDKVVLIDGPLLTEDASFLEDIIHKSKDKKYLNAVQFGSVGGHFGIPTNDASAPTNTLLPGGGIIRKRYDVAEIKKRCRFLKKCG